METTNIRIYFFDSNYRFIGSRLLLVGEVVPYNATTKEITLQDGYEAHLINGEWVASEIVEEVQEIIE